MADKHNRATAPKPQDPFWQIPLTDDGVQKDGYGLPIEGAKTDTEDKAAVVESQKVDSTPPIELTPGKGK